MKYYDGFVQHCKLARGCKDALDGKAVFQVLQMVIVACCGLLFLCLACLAMLKGAFVHIISAIYTKLNTVSIVVEIMETFDLNFGH